MGSFDWGAFAQGIGGTVLPALGVSPTISGLVSSIGAGFATTPEPTPENGWVAGAGGGPALGGGGIGGMISSGAALAAQAATMAPPPTGPLAGRTLIASGGQAKRDRWVEYLDTQGQRRYQIIQEDSPESDVAKMIVWKGFVPADSDIGHALMLQGKKSEKRNVKMSDGSVVSMDVVVIGKRRRRRNYATPIGIRNAGRTLRQMGQLVRTYKRLAAQGAKVHRQLSPSRGARGSHVHYRKPRAVTGVRKRKAS